MSSRRYHLELSRQREVVISDAPFIVLAGDQGIEVGTTGVPTRYAVCLPTRDSRVAAMLYHESWNAETAFVIEQLAYRERRPHLMLPSIRIYAGQHGECLGYITQDIGRCVPLRYYLDEMDHFGRLSEKVLVNLARGIVRCGQECLEIALYPEVLAEDFVVNHRGEVFLTGLEITASFQTRTNDLSFKWLGPRSSDVAKAYAERSFFCVAARVLTYRRPQPFLVPTIMKLLTR